MGFRTNAYATVWEVKPKSDVITNVRLSIGKKNKDTGEYVTEYSGYVDFIGSKAAQKALSLNEKDKIQIGDCDVTNYYNKEKNITYTNCKVFSFKTQAEIDQGKNPTPDEASEFMKVEEGDPHEGLPF